MAHKKGLGSTRNGRDSHAKRLGVKMFAGQQIKTGQIIVRQPQRSKNFQIHIIYFIIIPVRRNLHISFRRPDAREKRRAKKHDEKD